MSAKFLLLFLISIFSTKLVICDDHSNTNESQHNTAAVIFDLYLKSRGSPSLSELYSTLQSSDKSIEEIIDGINTNIKENLIKIDGDSIKFDNKATINLIQELIKIIKQNYFSNRKLCLIVERLIKQKIGQYSIEFEELLNQISIPLDSVNDRFTSVQKLQRNKRQIQSLSIIDTILNIFKQQIIQLIRRQISNLLRPLEKTILDSLTQLIDYIATFYTSVAPNSSFERLLMSSKNIVIRHSAEIIAIVQESISDLFDNFLGPETTTSLNRKFVPIEGQKVLTRN